MISAPGIERGRSSESRLRVHPAAATVFDALDRCGVRWCVLRGEDRLADPPHDVDLLVDRADLARLASAVRPLGFLPVPTWARGSHQFFVAYVQSLDRWFILDVVTELAYGPGYAIRTGAAAGCLTRRERVGGVPLLSADDGFWTLLLHYVLDRGDFPAHQKERVQGLSALARPDSALARFAAGLSPEGWSVARLLAEARSGQWDRLAALRPPMIREWRRSHPVEFRLRSLANRLAWRFAPLHTLAAQRGLCLAIVSHQPDVARSLAIGLRDGFYFPVTVLERPSVLAARCQQLRGRLVAVTVRDPPRGLRPDLVVHLPLHPSGADPNSARREVSAAIWRTYGERRGWTCAKAPPRPFRY